MNILSDIYSTLTTLEREFFETFDFLKYRTKAKVISVGNLSMGGTGKTPVLFEILKELQTQQPQKKLLVLTRGYRCPWENSFYELYGNGEHPFELTDEALMLNKRFPNIPVLVGKNRHHAAKIGEMHYQPDLILLDDGFQYRRLYKDFDILLWDSMSKPEEAQLIPSGRLREPIERLKQANAILLTRCESASKEQIDFWLKWLNEKAPGIPITKTHTLCEGLFKPDGQLSKLDDGTKLMAFSAIGRPESFYAQLEQCSYKIASKREFRDHHRFLDSELEELLKEASKNNLALVCTEKDAIKIKPKMAEKMNLNVLRIKSEPVSGRSFLEELGLDNPLC
ncbi:MAG: tetraacyldisaccharide 4'-kinase [Candidatus Riflebacteria bacterium]|nr:tetraacyldisaccharide 4'-kinase [Candidatus Riflebacteria bacterium]